MCFHIFLPDVPCLGCCRDGACLGSVLALGCCPMYFAITKPDFPFNVEEAVSSFVPEKCMITTIRTAVWHLTALYFPLRQKCCRVFRDLRSGQEKWPVSAVPISFYLLGFALSRAHSANAFLFCITHWWYSPQINPSLGIFHTVLLQWGKRNKYKVI